MSAVWMRYRAELRGRWRAYVGLVLLIAAIGGGALAAGAGARRTMSAYPRFLERYPGADVTVSIAGQPKAPQIFDAVEHLPSVEKAARPELFFGRVRTTAGKEFEFPDVFLVSGTKRDPDFRRDYKMLEGQPPRAESADELMANYVMAERLDLKLGDRLTVTVVTFPGVVPTRERSGTYTVSGVYATVGEFETLTESGFPSTLAFSPAFFARHEDLRAPIDAGSDMGLKLRAGAAGLADFNRELRATRIDVGEGPTPLIDLLDGNPNPNTLFTPAVQSMNRMPATTLALLAAFLALAVAAVAGQSLGRESTLRVDDVETLRALGMSGRARAAAELVRAGVIAGAGAAGAIIVAIALSPLTPVGLARVAEPDPGISLDLSALGAGALALIVLIMLAAVPAAVRAALRGVTRQETRRSAIAEGLSRTGAPPTAVTGVALALSSGRGKANVPVRTTILGVAVAVAMLVAALGFRASMDRLRADPELSGFKYDAVVLSFEGPDALIAPLRSMREVARVWRGSAFGAATVGGLTPLTVTSYEGVEPALTSGRAPRTAREIALDGRTMRVLSLAIGDTAPVAKSPSFPGEKVPPPRTMKVVGQFVPPRFPFLGDYPGQGVAMTKQGIESFGGEWDGAYVRFAPGVDLEQGVTALRDAFRGRIFAVASRAQSVSARNVASIARVPLILAAALGLLGAATLIHTMLLTVRRRRKDLAMLKTLGFVGRQIRATVAWQATTIVLLALAIGIPLGVLLGRWGWRLFATQIEVVPLPVLPTLLVPAAIVLALAAGNLIAAIPARSAARTRPALVLRSE